MKKSMLSLAVAALSMLSAYAGGKGMLILQCGSDWCESGECVRQVFKSQEFRKAVGGRFELAVYDEMENPTPKVKAENAKLDSLRVPTVRFPAITCLTGEPHRLFAQLENIPFDVTPKSLAEMVETAVKNKAEAESLFKHGRGRGQSPADALGHGFEILEAQVGEFNRDRLFEGSLAWEEQWTHLQEIDEDDRYGWRLRFTIGNGYDLIAKATELGKEGDAEKWEKFITPIRAVPTNALSVVQRQSLELIEFAYAHATGSGSDFFSASDADVMHRILDMDRNTVWGQFALGKLIQSGENIETVKPYRVKVRPRSEGGKRVAAAFKLRDAEERVAFAFVSEQYGTRTFFTQTLGWCAKFVFSDDARSKRFIDLFPKMAAKFEKSMRGKKGATKIIAAAMNGKPDLGSFIEQAENSGDLIAFRQFAAMQEKVSQELPRKSYRFEFKHGHCPRARYVRVRRTVIPEEKRKKTEKDIEMPDTLRMSKILVYGKKLY